MRVTAWVHHFQIHIFTVFCLCIILTIFYLWTNLLEKRVFKIKVKEEFQICEMSEFGFDNVNNLYSRMENPRTVFKYISNARIILSRVAKTKWPSDQNWRVPIVLVICFLGYLDDMKQTYMKVSMILDNMYHPSRRLQVLNCRNISRKESGIFVFGDFLEWRDHLHQLFPSSIIVWGYFSE